MKFHIILQNGDRLRETTESLCSDATNTSTQSTVGTHVQNTA